MASEIILGLLIVLAACVIVIPGLGLIMLGILSTMFWIAIAMIVCFLILFTIAWCYFKFRGW